MAVYRMRNRLPELLPGNSSIKTDIVIEPSLADAAPELIRRIGFGGKQLLVVCDKNTHAALGRRLMAELSDFSEQLLILKGKAYADEVGVSQIRAHTFDALIAVGSGVVSDLCKFASHAENKPYAVFPTAPSMNGYLSSSASMTLNAVKESRPARLPAGVFCDLKVISSAPARLIRSGLGDSVCRPTAQADWLLSHLLLGTPYDGRLYELLAPYEAELFAHADRLASGDTGAVDLLMRALLVSGLGMTLNGDSRPASQGEHMIAHTMEMKHKATLPETWHGEQIGVATLTMAKIQHDLLARELTLPEKPNWEEALALYFGRKQAQYLSPGPEQKYRLYERREVIVAKLRASEAEVRERLSKVMLPEAQLRAILMKAGAPTTPEALGWNEEAYGAAVAHARFTRDRFTFLDLAMH